MGGSLSKGSYRVPSTGFGFDIKPVYSSSFSDVDGFFPILAALCWLVSEVGWGLIYIYMYVYVVGWGVGLWLFLYIASFDLVGTQL